MSDFFTERIEDQRAVMALMAGDRKIMEAIHKGADLMVSVLRGGGSVLLCGNGGSAGDAQHIAAELVSRFYKERRALNAEALTVNTSSITAIANDYSYDSIFERQVEAKGRQGDLLVGISTSGDSPNIIRAIKKGKEIGMNTIGLTGGNESSLIFSTANLVVGVPSTVTPRIQEAHIVIGHAWCEYVEEKLFG